MLFRRPPELVDRSRDSALLLQLLDDTWAWRQRLVLSLRFGAPSHVRVESRYQIELPLALLQSFDVPSGATTLRLLLPITTRPKEMLLNFDLTGPNGAPAHLLTRASIASLQAEYLSRALETSPAEGQLPGLDTQVLEAICLFTPGTYRTYGAPEDETTLLTYLVRGTGLDITADHVSRWRRTLAPAAETLAEALGEPRSDESSAENLLLAIPLLERDLSVDGIDQLVERYATAVAALERADDQYLLTGLADYGRRWEMVVETELPVGRPATVIVAEDQPIVPDAAGRVLRRVAFRDARSIHIQAAVDDRALEIDDMKVRALRGEALAPFEGIRETPEFRAVYTSNPFRPDDVEVEVALRPVAEARWAAASQLLVRESSSLARRLQRRRFLVVLAASTVLWAIVVVQVFRLASPSWLPKLW